MALIRALSGSSGGGNNPTYESDTISAGVTKTINNIDNAFYAVIITDSANYYLCGYIINGVHDNTIGRKTGFDSSYSGGNLTITNTRTSGTYKLMIFRT